MYVGLGAHHTSAWRGAFIAEAIDWMLVQMLRTIRLSKRATGEPVLGILEVHYDGR